MALLDKSALVRVALDSWAEIEAQLKVIPSSYPDPNTFMTTEQVACLLAISARTLENWRLDQRGPAITRIAGMPRYRYSDLLEWVHEQNA